MPCSSVIKCINKILYEIHTVEKCDLLKPKMCSQIDPMIMWQTVQRIVTRLRLGGANWGANSPLGSLHEGTQLGKGYGEFSSS